MQLFGGEVKIGLVAKARIPDRRLEAAVLIHHHSLDAINSIEIEWIKPPEQANVRTNQIEVLQQRLSQCRDI